MVTRSRMTWRRELRQSKQSGSEAKFSLSDVQKFNKITKVDLHQLYHEKMRRNVRTGVVVGMLQAVLTRRRVGQNNSMTLVGRRVETDVLLRTAARMNSVVNHLQERTGSRASRKSASAAPPPPPPAHDRQGRASLNGAARPEEASPEAASRGRANTEPALVEAMPALVEAESPTAPNGPEAAGTGDNEHELLAMGESGETKGMELPLPSLHSQTSSASFV